MPKAEKKEKPEKKEKKVKDPNAPKVGHFLQCHANQILVQPVDD